MMIAQHIESVIKMCGLDTARIVRCANALAKVVDERGLKGAPLWVGFDLNGPLVPTDASLAPYIGVRQCFDLLDCLPGVMPAIVTGWDLKSAEAFAARELGNGRVTMVTEKGMVASIRGKTIHYYPFNQEELNRFAEGVLMIASSRGLQICIQPNASSGCQCVFIEGFGRARLEQHPLQIMSNWSYGILKSALKEMGIHFDDRGGAVEVRAEAFELYEFFRSRLPLIPIRLSRFESSWLVTVDPVDNSEFSWAEFKCVSNEIAEYTSYKAFLNRDFNTDFLTNEAAAGGYAKHVTASKICLESFGERYILLNVGDKLDDAVRGKNAIFFPQVDTEAMDNDLPDNIPVRCGREYALAVAVYYHGVMKKVIF